MWKRLELNHGLIADWYDLPDYTPHPNDIRFTWGEQFNYRNKGIQLEQWTIDYGLLEVFEITFIYYPPFTVMDSSFRSKEDILVARFQDLDQAMLWKLAYGFE